MGRDFLITQLASEDFSERLDDWGSLQFAKVNIFHPVDINDALEKIIKNQIKDDYFWEYQKLQFSGESVVVPNEIITTTRYSRTGCKRRVYSRTHKLREPKVSFTAHALERYYERSGRRGQTAKDFFSTEFSDWIDRMSGRTASSGVKTNWMLPFGYGVGEGAFLGMNFMRPISKNEQWKVFYKSNKPHRMRPSHDNDSILQKYFVAKTFIHQNMMSPKQKKLHQLIKERNYKNAFDLNNSMQRGLQLH